MDSTAESIDLPFASCYNENTAKRQYAVSSNAKRNEEYT